MSIAFKIAWRNIWRHKGKSIVIGIILFLGAFFMTMGNGMISGMKKGLQKNIVNSFTGDILIISDEQQKDNVLMDMMNAKPLKVIKDYEKIEKVIKKDSSINRFLPATAGMVFVFNPNGEMGNTFLIGADIRRYREMFPGNIEILEGRELKKGERGVLVSSESRKSAYDFMDFWLVPEGVSEEETAKPEDLEEWEELEIRRDMIIMGATTSNSTRDIKIPVKGIFKYNALNKFWGVYNIVDIESFREAHNYITGADSKVELSAEEEQLMGSENLDTMFESGDVFDDSTLVDESVTFEELKSETKRENKNIDLDSGSYNLMFVKLKNSDTKKNAIKQLNETFKKEGLGVRAVDWKKAVGTIGSMTSLIRGALFTFTMFIFFVAIIVIMNTLSMAALERIPEIAMMRAVGAQKSFLRRMFLSETGLLSFFFGGLGMIVGIIIVYILSSLDITTTNEFAQIVFGGEVLSPIITSFDLGIGILELIIVTLLAVIYPLRVVSKIVPLDAISRN
ncbi:MAG: ABC transporter permease [Fusobacteriota bacterium]